jgi:hypothetical protein
MQGLHNRTSHEESAMSLTFPYRFAVAMYSEDGTNLGTVLAKHDFEPAFEWARFYFQRRGQLGLDGNQAISTVTPLWEHTLGEPYCRGYRIQIDAPGLRPVASDFPDDAFPRVRCHGCVPFR